MKSLGSAEPGLKNTVFHTDKNGWFQLLLWRHYAHPILFPWVLDMRRAGWVRRPRRCDEGCTRRRPRTFSATARSPGGGIRSLRLARHPKSGTKRKFNYHELCGIVVLNQGAAKYSVRGAAKSHCYWPLGLFKHLGVPPNIDIAD